jgi:hypothetical protein
MPIITRQLTARSPGTETTNAPWLAHREKLDSLAAWVVPAARNPRHVSAWAETQSIFRGI